MPEVTLVLGGAASGKSDYAEKLILASGLRRHYLATAEPGDDEMRQKIFRHQARRGPGWTLREAMRDLPEAIAELPPGTVGLADCATTWLSAALVEGRDCEAEAATLLHAIGRCRARLVVVSDEIGQGVVPSNALGRRFREALGSLNRQIAARADSVVAVMAGLPLALKGPPPALPPDPVA